MAGRISGCNSTRHGSKSRRVDECVGDTAWYTLGRNDQASPHERLSHERDVRLPCSAWDAARCTISTSR